MVLSFTRNTGDPSTAFSKHFLMEKLKDVIGVAVVCGIMPLMMSFLPVFMVLTFYLLFTKYWWITVLLYSWVYYDFGTSKRGGRRYPPARRWATVIAGFVRDYLGVKLVKTADLDPERNYIIGFHPHGSTYGLLCNILTESTGFSDLYPGITPYTCVLNVFFMMPFLKEIVLALGAVHAGRDSFDWILSQGKGRAVVILVGGSYEVIEMHPGRMQMSTLKRRKGFVRMALKHGADLVPLLSFGDNDIYGQLPNEPGSLVRRMQEFMHRNTGTAVPYCPIGRYGIFPFRKPIHSVVGKPIRVEKVPDPSQEEIDALHKKYIEALQELFEEYKPKFPGGESLKLEL